MQVEMWSLDRIKPYENNPRINDAAVDPVVQSINEFGFRQPIVVHTDGVIIVGHTRCRAAKKLNLEKVPVHIATDPPPDAIKAYRIADNHETTSLNALRGHSHIKSPKREPAYLANFLTVHLFLRRLARQCFGTRAAFHSWSVD
ncbi:MAG: ParB N-terminal domain-containing protein [Rubripirellula sp.]